mmetsp:Transcript_7211/g.11407  ORF Transcript_7211/g.11407 Transcript_7211/m.11407 type:complete len:271 (+) Transcript_7211:236-1048(+)
MRTTTMARRTSLRLREGGEDISPCSLSHISVDATPVGSFENPIAAAGPPELYNPGAKSGVKINMSPPMTPTTDADSQTTCEWEKKRVLQVNYYINGVGEENFVPAEIVGDGTGLMRQIGYRTLRIKIRSMKRDGLTDLSNQIMAGFLRGRKRESKGEECTCSALMCFESDNTLEVMSCEARIVLSEMHSLEILPILHLRERTKFESLKELAEQMVTDLRCAQYLPSLSRKAEHVVNSNTTRCSGQPPFAYCQAPPCSTACSQTCKMCNIM